MTFLEFGNRLCYKREKNTSEREKEREKTEWSAGDVTDLLGEGVLS